MKFDVFACAVDGEILGATTVETAVERGEFRCMESPTIIAVQAGILCRFEAYSPDLDITVELPFDSDPKLVITGDQIHLMFNDGLMITSHPTRRRKL